MKKQEYALFSDRVKAAVLDSIILIFSIVGITYLFSMFESVHNNIRMGAFIFVFFLYDPIFTSSFGGTVGHYLIGIRVKRESNPDKNIYFHLAFIRFALKALLGWLSLVTVFTSKKRKALHDMVVHSIVIDKD